MNDKNTRRAISVKTDPDSKKKKGMSAETGIDLDAMTQNLLVKNFSSHDHSKIASTLQAIAHSSLRSGLSEQYNAHFEFVKTNVTMGAMPAAFANELRTEDRQKREGDSATTGENVCSHPGCLNCSTKRKLLKCGSCKHAQYCGNSYY
jgi:hypothetical protein